MRNISANVRGAALMTTAMAAYVSNDALMKLISDELGLFQALAIRGLFTIALIGLWALFRGELLAKIPKSDRPALLWRIVGEIGATFCFLTALFNMPIANATAILQALPLAVTLAAAMFLKEPVGWRRYSAIALGFIGVLIIVRPGSEGFNTYSILAVIAVGFIVLRDLATRRLSAEVPSLQVSLMTAVVITIASALVSQTETWAPVEMGTIAILAAASVFIVFGYLFGVMTMRVGEISFVAPFRYMSLLWAIVLGLLVFGDVPDLWTIIGSIIVVGTGIYTFYRERVRKELATKTK
ncbi:MAG: DMT family transporter [Pseudomonadota bacterium]